ncbi:uncharacterized protein LOC128387837 [Panonychus citri]|uniref:uncharacterized protein LOC128387837 n=1 Tax=Panonychus citri TaxID=50023 RepID=UPI0023083016|nr:uncharacterized protein LOC128387837 [Panonychus citri]
MGNWSSCCLPGNKNLDDGDGERTRILNDPTGDGRFVGEETCYTGDGVAINSKQSTDYGTINNGGSKNNEQSNAWHRILNKMLANVIDVSADVPPVEQNEYTERTRLYQNKINQLRQPLYLKYRLSNNKLTILNGSGSGSKRLIDNSSDLRDFPTPFKTISEEDLTLTNLISDKTLIAVKKGYAVNIEEQLVVQFNP